MPRNLEITQDDCQAVKICHRTSKTLPLSYKSFIYNFRLPFFIHKYWKENDSRKFLPERLTLPLSPFHSRKYQLDLKSSYDSNTNMNSHSIQPKSLSVLPYNGHCADRCSRGRPPTCGSGNECRVLTTRSRGFERISPRSPTRSAFPRWTHSN